MSRFWAPPILFIIKPSEDLRPFGPLALSVRIHGLFDEHDGNAVPDWISLAASFRGGTYYPISFLDDRRFAIGACKYL